MKKPYKPQIMCAIGMISKMTLIAFCTMMMSGCAIIYTARNQDAQTVRLLLKSAEDLEVTQATPVTTSDGKTVYDTHILAKFKKGQKICIRNTEGQYSMEEYEANPKLIKDGNELKVGFIVWNPMLTETLQECKEHKFN